MVDKKKRIKGF